MEENHDLVLGARRVSFKGGGKSLWWGERSGNGKGEGEGIFENWKN